MVPSTFTAGTSHLLQRAPQECQTATLELAIRHMDGGVFRQGLYDPGVLLPDATIEKIAASRKPETQELV